LSVTSSIKPIKKTGRVDIQKNISIFDSSFTPHMKKENTIKTGIPPNLDVG
jgi:hypothetical protein